MKRSFSKLVLAGLIAMAAISCKKFCAEPQQNFFEKPRYSTLEEFRRGISVVVNQIQEHNIKAYLDTLPNGYPNVQGRVEPLADFGFAILEKLSGNASQVQSAVYDVFHFDEKTFSLVSFLMKAQMTGNISYQTLVNITANIPLPPIAVAGFKPPVEIVAGAVVGDCCKDNVCNPEIKILVTWTYKAPCGNYEKKTSGYAANNTLSGMSGGKLYRFDAEVTGCPCPGTWTSKVTGPAGASFGASERGGTATVFPVTPGTYTITFTYKVCDKEVTKTFTLGVG